MLYVLVSSAFFAEEPLINSETRFPTCLYVRILSAKGDSNDDRSSSMYRRLWELVDKFKRTEKEPRNFHYGNRVAFSHVE